MGILIRGRKVFMDIERMFEDAVKNGLFTDFDVCVRGPYETSFSGGIHLTRGARLFDIASITKALTHLLLLRLFVEGRVRPDDKLAKYLVIPNSGHRELWHFMSYLAKKYAFHVDYDNLIGGEVGSLKELMLTKGFGEWTKKHKYENYSSMYLGFVLEKLFETGLEEIFHSQYCFDGEAEKLLFHPMRRGVDPSLIVPTRKEEHLRGMTFDPVASAHSAENLSIAGVFSNAKTVADIFHRTLEPIIRSGLYATASKNQLAGTDDEAAPWGLGFDIPVPERNLGSISGPLIFAGSTGCRIFFTERPRVTVCVLTNRVFFGNTVDSRERFSKFAWEVIREALRRATK